MKRSQLALIVAAIFGIIAIFSLRESGTDGSGPDKETASDLESNTPGADATGLKKVAAPQKTPEIFFLNEAGAEADVNRAIAHRRPKETGSRRIVGSRAITSPEEGDFMSPRWSPDGLELLFSKAGYNGLYTRGINGGDINQVSGKGNIGFGASWDEDGQIKTRTNSGEEQAFNPDGTPVDSVAMVDDLSRTGVFTKDDNVYIRNSEGEAAIPVSSGEDRYFGGVLSPDGQYIVYNGLNTGLYIQPVDGSSPPVHLGAGVHPSWLPDSSGIVYSYTEDDGHNLVRGDIYLASRDGSQVSNLTQGSPGIEQNPSVSPDGTTIAYESDGAIHVGSLQ